MVPGGAFDEFGNGAWDAVDDEIGKLDLHGSR